MEVALDPQLTSIIIDRRNELVDAWSDLVEKEVEQSGLSSEAGHQGWMSSFISLFIRRLENPDEGNILPFIRSLVQRGYLSRYKAGAIVHIFHLLYRALSTVLAKGSSIPLPLDEIVNAMNPIIVAASNFYDERLGASDERFEALLDNADLLILNIDISGKIKKVNLRGAKILGASQEELMGKALSHIVYHEDLEIITRAFGHVLTGNPQIFAIRTKLPHGAIGNLDMTLTPVIEGGRIINIRAIARNVTEKMDLQQKLFESEQKYRSLIEKAGDAIILLAIEDGTILEANSQARKMSGLSIEEIRDFSIVELFDKKDEKHVISFLQETITTKSSVSQQITLLCALGPDVNVVLSGAVIQFVGNKVIQIFAKDTGQQLRVERKHYELKKRLDNSNKEIAGLKERESFLERPSRAWGLLLGLFERLDQDYQSSLRSKEDRVSKEIRLIFRRSAEILRPMSSGNNPILIHVGRLLERYLDIFKRIYKDRITFEFHSISAAMVMAAPEDFETTLVSLINQAIQVSLNSEKAFVKISVKNLERMILVEVTDSGKILNKDQWKKLFSNEVKIPKRDANVLLSARKFLERFGGGLLVQSDPDKGNIITIYLPSEEEMREKESTDYQLVILDEKNKKNE